MRHAPDCEYPHDKEQPDRLVGLMELHIHDESQALGLGRWALHNERMERIAQLMRQERAARPTTPDAGGER